MSFCYVQVFISTQHCYLVCNAFAWRWRRHFNYTGFSAQNQCNCVWRCVVNVVQICILSTNLCNSSRPFNFSSASRRLESHKFQMSFLTKKLEGTVHVTCQWPIFYGFYWNCFMLEEEEKKVWLAYFEALLQKNHPLRYADVDLGFYIFLL